MLRAILSWRQHPTKQQLYWKLPPITKTIKVRRTRLAGHCWISKDELISDILLLTPSHGRAKAGRPARTYIHQLCADTGCSLEDLPGVMGDRDGCWERVKEIRAGGATWWWCMYLYLYVTHIQSLTKIMKSIHLDDVHFSFYLAANKLIADKTQSILLILLYLVAFTWA